MLWAVLCFIMLVILIGIEQKSSKKKGREHSEEIAGVGFFLSTDYREDIGAEPMDNGGEGDGM